MLARESGSPYSRGRDQMALIYPAPYRAGMASLGYLSVFRALNEAPHLSCERAFSDTPAGDGPVHTLETRRPLNQFPLVAISISWELELLELITMLERSHIPAKRTERGDTDPLIIAGGPLTTVAPELLAPVADLVFLGESELSLAAFTAVLEKSPDRNDLLNSACHIEGVWVPARNTERPAMAPCTPVELLPAVSTFTTPEAEFGAKRLIEVERGCSRGCAFCVMSRHTAGGGMRLVPVDRILTHLTPVPPSVGLVGAAVTDHPDLKQILNHCISGGSEVSLSSLRADRLDDELLSLLRAGGMKTLTVAADAPSQRISREIQKEISPATLIDVASRARALGIPRMKLYQMAGFPTEEPEDLHEMGELLVALSQHISLTVTLSPLVPKPGTPLAGAPLPGERYIKEMLKKLRRITKGRVILKPVSWRDAALEYALDTLGTRALRLLHDLLEGNASRGTIVQQLMKAL